jgi:DNA gyrase subunit B
MVRFIRIRKGKALYPVKQIGETTKEERLLPDPTIFLLKLQYSYGYSQRMRELSFLNKGITITFTDKRIR